MNSKIIFFVLAVAIGGISAREEVPKNPPQISAVSEPTPEPVNGKTQTFDRALQTAAKSYQERLAQAASELTRMRQRIGEEKGPLLKQMRAAQDRLLAAESETNRLGTRREDNGELRRKLLLELDAIRKTSSYAGTLVHDAVKTVGDSLSPGEEQQIGDEISNLRERLDSSDLAVRNAALSDSVDFLFINTDRCLGGYRATGKAMINESHDVVSGTFAFVGPETFFHPDNGSKSGVVRSREGAKYPTNYSIAAWQLQDAERFFSGQAGSIAADSSNGKALRLSETTGTLFAHIKKGGWVAFAIVVVGGLAATLILLKIRDLRRMGVDDAIKVAGFLKLVTDGSWTEAEKAARALKRSTRELFETGLLYRDQPSAILEERLQAVLLEQRLNSERRLPLLAVIATAAPLMGLLGTVVGMVKTFALITVFGTGNAGKLSSGISEVLVSTELGLAVAIPTLVAHGFLAHRIQRNLSVLERYALQFTTAIQTANSGETISKRTTG